MYWNTAQLLKRMKYWFSVNEPWRHYAERKNLEAKKSYMYDSVYMK